MLSIVFQFLFWLYRGTSLCLVGKEDKFSHIILGDEEAWRLFDNREDVGAGLRPQKPVSPGVVLLYTRANLKVMTNRRSPSRVSRAPSTAQPASLCYFVSSNSYQKWLKLYIYNVMT